MMHSITRGDVCPVWTKCRCKTSRMYAGSWAGEIDGPSTMRGPSYGPDSSSG
jgi:hypothetical protein